MFADKSSRFIDTDRVIKLATGYRLSVADPEEVEPKLMRIRAPKYRERPRTYSVTCPECGCEWEKGEPESSMLHRKEHKRRMDWLAPKPKPQMVAELAEKGLEAELVTWDSPEWKHTEMYNRALAFKRELHYDFVQWKSKNDREDYDVHGYLMTNEQGAIVGACAFRNRSEDPGRKNGVYNGSGYVLKNDEPDTWHDAGRDSVNSSVISLSNYRSLMRCKPFCKKMETVT